MAQLSIATGVPDPAMTVGMAPALGTLPQGGYAANTPSDLNAQSAPGYMAAPGGFAGQAAYAYGQHAAQTNAYTQPAGVVSGTSTPAAPLADHQLTQMGHASQTMGLTSAGHPPGGLPYGYAGLTGHSSWAQRTTMQAGGTAIQGQVQGVPQTPPPPAFGAANTVAGAYPQPASTPSVGTSTTASAKASAVQFGVPAGTGANGVHGTTVQRPSTAASTPLRDDEQLVGNGMMGRIDIQRAPSTGCTWLDPPMPLQVYQTMPPILENRLPLAKWTAFVTEVNEVLKSANEKAHIPVAVRRIGVVCLPFFIGCFWYTAISLATSSCANIFSSLFVVLVSLLGPPIILTTGARVLTLQIGSSEELSVRYVEQACKALTSELSGIHFGLKINQTLKGPAYYVEASMIDKDVAQAIATAAPMMLGMGAPHKPV